MSRLRNIPAAKEAVKNNPRVLKNPVVSAEVFGNDHPLQLEIGMGKGRFIMGMAKLHPGINYIGVEVYESVLYRALQKLERIEKNPEDLSVDDMERDETESGNNNGSVEVVETQTADGSIACDKESDEANDNANGNASDEACDVYSNLRFLCVNAADLSEYLTDGSVDKIYLNFSDPWPKERHAHRRLVSANFLKLFSRLLKDEGIIEFKTDNVGLFEYGLTQIEEAGYELLYENRDLHADEAEMKENVMTEYEEKFSAKGNKICKFRIKKQ